MKLGCQTISYSWDKVMMFHLDDSIGEHIIYFVFIHCSKLNFIVSDVSVNGFESHGISSKNK